MPDPNFFLLYVDSPEASAAFYARLPGHAPAEASPTFAMFALGSGTMLGLWSRHTVEPAPSGTGASTELAFAVADAAAVAATCDTWRGLGLTILQQPTDMDFGRTFVAADPDGHRLRVFAPAAP
jgi:predicted enzyme related to lactoylglutathione lyase